MSELRYETPATVEAAAALLASAAGPARVLAGGTDMLVQMRSGRVKPELLVDVKHISEMTSLKQENGGWRVGAAVNCMALVENKEFAAMECKLTQIIQLTDLQGTKINAWLTIGEVIGVHIKNEFIKDGIFDTAAARPLGRCGYRGDYVEVNKIFEMVRPKEYTGTI